MRGCVPRFGQTHGSAPTVYTPRSICVTSPTNYFLGPIEQCSLLTLLKHCCARCKNSNKFGFNSLASALRHPPGYSYAVATCDQWLLALSIGQFVLLRPQIVFLAPLIALAYRAPRGTNCVCAARDYSLLVLSIGQFVLLRPQIAPLSFAQIRLRSA